MNTNSPPAADSPPPPRTPAPRARPKKVYVTATLHTHLPPFVPFLLGSASPSSSMSSSSPMSSTNRSSSSISFSLSYVITPSTPITCFLVQYLVELLRSEVVDVAVRSLLQTLQQLRFDRLLQLRRALRLLLSDGLTLLRLAVDALVHRSCFQFHPNPTASGGAACACAKGTGGCGGNAPCFG